MRRVSWPGLVLVGVLVDSALLVNPNPRPSGITARLMIRSRHRSSDTEDTCIRSISIRILRGVKLSPKPDARVREVLRHWHGATDHLVYNGHVLGRLQLDERHILAAELRNELHCVGKSSRDQSVVEQERIVIDAKSARDHVISRRWTCHNQVKPTAL